MKKLISLFVSGIVAVTTSLTGSIVTDADEEISENILMMCCSVKFGMKQLSTQRQSALLQLYHLWLQESLILR